MTALAVLLLSVGVWCALALWFRLEVGHLGRDVAGAAMLAAAAVAAACLATRSRWRMLLPYAGLVLLVLVWWLSLRPSNDRPWAPDVARAATGTVDGDRLVVDNVRDFAWRSPTDFDQRWERRSYDLSRLSGVDLVMSHWAGEEIAHTILSFGFSDGSRLAFSIEIRKEQSEAFSTLAGFFKQYEIAMIAADERDVVRVRSSIRGEDVRIYRLRVAPASGRKLLEVYIAEANEIAQRPRFYNTLTTNCTTLAFQLVQVVHPTLPLDPRILVLGHLPNYAYEIGAANTAIPFSELRERAKIHDSAPASGDDPSFSARIREGVPPAYGG